MSVKQIFNTSAELDYPTVLPTLDLDFANSKTLDPRITFTRSSGGSYVGADGLIKLAGVNEARFDHDPYTGESLGLLIEESRTNLVLRSEDFEAGWAKVNSSVTVNATIAPDGTLSAENFIENTSNSQHEVRQTTPTLTSGTSYTFSIFAKSNGSGRQLQVIFPVAIAGHGAVFNLDLGTATAIGNTITASIQEYQNGWYRCVCTATASSSTVFPIRSLTNNGFVNIYQGDGISGLFLWGGQLEEGPFPTSYIPTEASTRTRAADNASITGKNFSDFYRQDEGSIFVRFSIKGIFGVDGYNRVFHLSDGTSNNVFALLSLSANDDMYDAWIINGTEQLNFNAINTIFGRFYNYVAGYKKNDFQRYSIDVNGILDSNTDTSISISTFNQLDIGRERDLGVGRNTNGYISRLTYYPKRLPNSQLITLTS